MERLFLFNPENDIALADGKAGFTPPKNAAELHRRGAMLPWWLGSENDAVLVDERDLAAAGRYAALMEERFGPGPGIVSSVEGRHVGRFVPWGWSANTLRQFERAGAVFDQEEAGRMERLRQLSHRRSSIIINKSLAEASIGEFPPLPREISSASGLKRVIEEWGDVFVKAPWSSTGRGVIRSSDMSIDELLRRTEGTIRRQGSVLVEKAMDKVADFAMLFRSAGGEVDFAGYSLFFNGHGSSYGGNLLLDDDEIERYLAGFVPRRLLRDVALSLRGILTGMVAADYHGFFGIDMMVCGNGLGGYMLAPCVELNLRLTMGVVAHRLSERFKGAGYERLLVAPSSAAPDNAFWLVPRNDSYFIGLA